MPAGIYTILNNRSEPNDNPVLITKGASLLTSAQARAHMLCSECEARFNKGGEEWVIENCWHGEREFPLRTALMAAMPLVDEPGFRVYEARNVAGVDVDRLVYFAASVFWRGALDGWRIGKGRPTRLMLGPYEKAFRLFLMGDTPFPEHVLLVITLSEAQDNLINRNMALPSGGEQSEYGRHYEFVVPGITFHILVGKHIPAWMREIGTVRGEFLFISSENDARKLTALLSATKDAPRRGKLAKSARPSSS